MRQREAAATAGLAWNAIPSPAARASADRWRRRRSPASLAAARRIPRRARAGVALGLPGDDRRPRRFRRFGRRRCRADWRRPGRSRVRAATRSANTVNPPDTSAVQTPAAREVATSSRAPGISRMRAAASSRTEAGRPRNSATRSAQRGGKIEFAVHRAPGDLGDMGAQADEIGQLVEHLVLDDRRFQIGDEHPLAPLRRRLHQHIDRRVADHRPRRRFGGCRIVARAAGRRQRRAPANRRFASASMSAIAAAMIRQCPAPPARRSGS